MPIPKSQQAAVERYKKQNYDRKVVTFHKGDLPRVAAAAAAIGESANQYIVTATLNRMEKGE